MSTERKPAGSRTFGLDAGTVTGVAGAGTMGTGIAQVAATAGHPVRLYDADAGALDRSRASLEMLFAKLVGKGRVQDAEAQRILGRIQWIASPEGFADCGLVIEAVVEDLDVKRQLFGRLAETVGPGCVLATNTSSLPVTAVAAGCPGPERVAGLHFFNPAPLMPLVEIVPGLATAGELPALLRERMIAWGKDPVIARDTPGFIVNRIARPFYGEALRIHEEGLAGIAAIDEAMRTLGGFRMGPFELMDLIGNDVNYAVTVSVWEQLHYDARYRPSVIQRRMVEAGRLGRKSGRGYYAYGDDGQRQGGDDRPGDAKAVFMRILCMLINEAADALHWGVAGRDDIETAMTRGVNYPRGLLRWADEIGIGTVYDTLCALRDDYREDRYRPSVLLKRMASAGMRFFS